MPAPSYTRVPAIMDGLIAIFRANALAAAASLPAQPDGSPAVVEVTDGPPDQGGALPDNYVAVGYTAAFAAAAFSGSSGLAVEGAMDISDVGNRQLFEQPSIECECSTFSGDADPGAVSRQRLRTGAVFSTMVAALQGDPTVGGVVGGVGRQEYACIGGYRWLIDPNRDGASVTVQFAVRIVGELWLPV